MVQVLEAQEAAYRCGVALDQSVETDPPKWRDAVNEVTKFVDVLRNFGPRANLTGRRHGVEAGSSEFGQESGVYKDSLGNEPEWAELTEALDDPKTL